MRDDLVSGLRQIRRNPGFACAVVLTLALGIGSTTAVFTLADPMLFRPLPYPESDRLVRAFSPGQGLHIADYLAARERHAGFEQIADFSGPTFARIVGADGSRMGYSVDAGFLEMLGVVPAVGRLFLASEYAAPPAMPDVATVTWQFWQTAFGGRADILEQSLDISGQPRRQARIVGVLPRDFVFPDHTNQVPAFLLPGGHDQTAADNVLSRMAPLARLARGTSIDAARSELQALVSAMEREYPAFAQNREVRLVPLRDALFGSVRTPLIMLLSATACLLLLACANLAHLFRARLHARRAELGVRLALGGGPGRLTRYLFAEAAILGVAGGAAALAAGQWIFAAVIAYTPQLAHVYRLLPARIDARVVIFATLLVMSVLFLSALLPALAAARADVRESLDGGGTAAGSRGTRRLQRSLIGAQAAVTVTLLITSALIVGSFVRLAYQPIGWNPSGLHSITIAMPAGTDVERRSAVYLDVYTRLAEHLQRRVALADGIPGLTIAGSAAAANADAADSVRAYAYRTTETVFDVFGLRLQRGRTFEEQEARIGAPVAVVDERAAESLWPGVDPLGRQIVDSGGTAHTVIGVVTTIRSSLRDNDSSPGTVLLPLGSAPVLHLLGTGDASRRISDIQRIVQNVESRASVGVSALSVFEREIGQPRFLAVLLGAVGLLTMALAVVGVFGIVSHQTVRRTRELGIRLALGAQAAQVRRLVVRDAMLPAGVGVAIGAAASLWWTQSLRTLLFEMDPHDPATFAAAGTIVLALVAVASLIPAAGAARTDPARTLRME